MMILLFTILSVLGSILWTQRAYAYLDPGTASMITATIAGGVAGLLVASKMFMGRIRSFFGLKEKEEEKKEENESLKEDEEIK